MAYQSPSGGLQLGRPSPHSSSIPTRCRFTPSFARVVQILRATGEALPEAAETIIPFVRAESGQSFTTIFSLSQESDAFFQMAPKTVLDLIAAIVGDAAPGSVFSLGPTLPRLQDLAPDLAATRKSQKLLIAASPHV